MPNPAPHDLGALAMDIMDALDAAAAELEKAARAQRTRLSRNGFSVADVKQLRCMLAEKQMFYAQSHLVGLALEQMLDDNAPHANTARQIHAAIKVLSGAEGDLLRTRKVARKIEQVLEKVVKLARRIGAAVA